MISIALEKDGFEVKQFFASKEGMQRSLRSWSTSLKNTFCFIEHGNRKYNLPLLEPKVANNAKTSSGEIV
jgi:hypothetical protein